MPTSGECHQGSSVAWASEPDSSGISKISVESGEGGMSRSLCREGLSLLRVRLCDGDAGDGEGGIIKPSDFSCMSMSSATSAGSPLAFPDSKSTLVGKDGRGRSCRLDFLFPFRMDSPFLSIRSKLSRTALDSSSTLDESAGLSR